MLEIINAFSQVVGRELPYEVVGRRKGDVLDLTAVPKRANVELGWKAEKTLENACADLWKWVFNNPQGYRQDAPEKLLKELEEVKKTQAINPTA